MIVVVVLMFETENAHLRSPAANICSRCLDSSILCWSWSRFSSYRAVNIEALTVINAAECIFHIYNGSQCTT